MKNFVLAIYLLVSSFSFAQKEKVELYIDIYKNIAMQEMQRTGVPASITLAQGILESRFGQSDLSVRSNNHFGIKCKLDWNGERVYSDDDTKQECFRKYPSPQDSYKDHSDFLKSRQHYAWLFNLDPADYHAWAKGLKKSGYATESDYAERLVDLIEKYNLNQYSLIALNKISAPANQENLAVNINNTQKPKPTITAIATTVVADEADETETVKPGTVTKNIEQHVSYPENLFTINGAKVIYAKTGTSLLAVANEYNISLSKLLDINDMNEVDVLENDKLIFIEKKQKKGDKDFHIVQPNETIHDIAQKEGIRMDVLVEYNGVSDKLNPVTGEKIYLRGKAPVSPKMTAMKNSL